MSDHETDGPMKNEMPVIIWAWRDGEYESRMWMTDHPNPVYRDPKSARYMKSYIVDEIIAERDALRAENERLREELEEKWESMDSAPEDGTLVKILHCEGMEVAWFADGPREWLTREGKAVLADPLMWHHTFDM